MISFPLILCILDSEEDRDKLQEIYDKYLGFMTAVARKYVHASDYDIEDIVSNSIIKLIDNLNNVDLTNKSTACSYIWSIVKSCAYDWLRKEKKLYSEEEIEDIDIEDISSSLAYDEPPHIDRIITKEGYNYIVQCIRSIKNTYRDVCELRLVYNMSYEQISKELGITVKNVSARYSRGIRQIKLKLKKGGYYDEQFRK